MSVSGSGSCPTGEQLSAFCLGTLPETDLAAVAEHLDCCAACATLLDSLHGQSDTVVSLLRGSGPAPFLDEPELARMQARARAIGSARPDAAERLASVESSRPRDAADSAVPTQIKQYRLLDMLGHGSFGTVWRAHDTQLDRTVAIKLPQFRESQGDEGHTFLREARAVAELKHPNIIAVLDVIVESDRSFIVSEFVQAVTLKTWLATHQPTPHEAADLCAKLADALDHAHVRGVVHRDLKPSNILIDEAGQPHVTDFGLARRDALETTITATGEILGTPAYMSPEQADGRSHQVDGRSDVYALGVVLYELLTGRLPFQERSIVATLQHVLSEPPPAPRALRPAIPRDLDTICLKCLEKERRRRYPSAAALADDLRRFLAGEPTKARPVSAVERTWRWAKQRPSVAALLGVIVIALIGAVIASAYHTKRLNDALVESVQNHKIATRNAERTRLLLYCADMKLAGQAWADGDVLQMLDILNRHRPQIGQTDLRGFEWRLLAGQAQLDDPEPVTLADHAGDVYYVCYSPNGKILATSGKDGTVRLYDEEGKLQRTLATGQGEVNGATFTTDGRQLITAGDDGTVRLWHLHTGEQVLKIQAHEARAHLAVCSRDGKSLVTCGNEPVIRIWDIETGAPVGRLEGHSAAVENIALSQDGSRLLSASADRTGRVWNLDSRREIWQIRESGRTTSVCWSPSGDHFVVGSLNCFAEILRHSGDRLRRLNHFDGVQAVACDPSGNTVVTADRGGIVHLWALPEAERSPEGDGQVELLRAWQAHEGRIWSVNFSPNGRLATAGADGTCKLWNVPHRGITILGDPRHPETQGMAFIDTNALATCNGTALIIWDVTRRTAVRTVELEGDDWQPIAASRLANLIVLGNRRGQISFWSFENLKRSMTWSGTPNTPVHWLGVVPDGSLLFARTDEQFVTLAAPDWQPVDGFPKAFCNAASLSSDGRWLAISTTPDDQIEIWDVAQMQIAQKLQGHTSSISTLAFSHDSRLLASGSNDRLVKIWHVETGALLATLVGHRERVHLLAFSGDGRTLASADMSGNGRVKFWNVAASRHLYDLAMPVRCDLRQMAFSPDGRHLLVLSKNGELFPFTNHWQTR